MSFSQGDILIANKLDSSANDVVFVNYINKEKEGGGMWDCIIIIEDSSFNGGQVQTRASSDGYRLILRRRVLIETYEETHIPYFYI